MNSKRSIAAVLWTAIVFTCLPAKADHVVYLDFDTAGFDLNAFGISNSGTVATVRNLIRELMFEDYAAYEVTITPFEPNNGRFTRVIIGGTDPRSNSSSFGTVSSAASIGGFSGTGIDSWEEDESVAFVFSDEFSSYSQFQGSNATAARISNAVAHTASHELGHILSLLHGHAYNDFPGTSDPDVNEHIMATGSTGLSMPDRATVDRFFSPAISNDRVIEGVKVYAYHDTLHNMNGDGSGQADLLYGKTDSPTAMHWWERNSDGSTWGSNSTWTSDGGDAGDIFLAGDINGDGDDDLVYGRAESSSQVRWFVRRSLGNGFSGFEEWSTDAGDVGDIFRLADVNGDNRVDLVYGRPVSDSQVTWYVRQSTGSTFGGYTAWAGDAGDVGDWFFVTDIDQDGDADLVYSRALSDTQVAWYVRKSSGSSFGGYTTWASDAGDKTDRFLLGDINGDNDSDLVYGRKINNNTIEWYMRRSLGTTWTSYFETWSTDAGNAGDVHRLGDIDGDGRVDLVYARELDFDTMKWWNRFSTGSAFGSLNTLVNDAGGEGFVIP